ncbi:MAG: response regulator [Lunatimonas sp.]|uniref:hybrid sensor histidine kinase/response regulator n=1 Tax=Lunatimonas sp. TaxID=2060141 RepID=UPI00263A6192|nr:hybrid sensor histidine kinase/response regulator [Lunatimonas sp.]MCC5937415.1 response regulator [Lunatimonas sp.]
MNRDYFKVLYVDDDIDDFLLVQSLLRQCQSSRFELVHSNSYETALDMLDQEFDVFLVDYKLGKNTGIDVLEAIKKRLRHAPVIILTGMENTDADKEAMEFGASDYLVKGGFNAQMLERTIRYAVRDAALHESLDIAGKKFKNIFERSADPIVLVNAESLVLDANPSFSQKFGYDPSKKDFYPFYLKDIVVEEAGKSQFDSLLHSKREFSDFQVTLTIPSGQTIEALISIAQDDSEKELFQLMIKDLTLLKVQEEDLYNMKKFSSTGRIARILAHEVKNPLTTILLSAEQLEFELPKDALDESGDLIGVIKKNCTRINQLITQLLDSTRFTEVDLQEHNINDLLDESLELVKDRIDLQQVRVVKDYESSICNIKVDADKVKIAFVNLLVNAVEAMDTREGVVRIRTRSKGSKCQIEISDNGKGIPKEHMDRLFEPFYTSKPTGSGLGLTNTQNIILSHGGAIRVKSNSNEGTTFYITFELAKNLN